MAPKKQCDLDTVGLMHIRTQPVTVCTPLAKLKPDKNQHEKGERTQSFTLTKKQFAMDTCWENQFIRENQFSGLLKNN